eukprot:gnl/Hemi2/4344_TR1533_c0_g1_i1.p1 gnl/Hemi2/4344_TR1533_c0_g1~~gnl/Hemi2/4344_TR1533_c0_g1_i1.p1  ORF type:complete len:331 (+),score=103.17 gnl/Hemi2/4344_TR1533_c0_g1_i1:169-1161(+)
MAPKVRHGGSNGGSGAYGDSGGGGSDGLGTGGGGLGSTALMAGVVAALIVLVVVGKLFGGKRRAGIKPFVKPDGNRFMRIEDEFESLNDIKNALRQAELEGCNLIVAVDYTSSNKSQGDRTFGGRSLHYVDPTGKTNNPYQEVISIIGRTLADFDDDKIIPLFGFGDASTTDHSVFPMFTDRGCNGLEDLLNSYNAYTPNVDLSGPTSFTPAIRAAVNIVREARNSYHILLLITDGMTMKPQLDATTIVEASNYPLSIVCVGVGDGPFDKMVQFDDELPERMFDNFQFVKWSDVWSLSHHRDVEFAKRALMEIPEQFQAIRHLGLLGSQA